MKKIIAALLAAALVATAALAQEIEISGEIKTGFLYEQRDLEGKTTSSARMHNNDGDSGPREGRLRFGINSQVDNFGLRTRFSQTSFWRATGVTDTNIERIFTDFAYAYVDLLDKQLTVSAGLLGESSWGTGGPELFIELEESLLGIRAEWKPNFLPFLNGLNLGFALLQANGQAPFDAKQEFGDIIKESLVGIAYEHEYFSFRFAYHFDRGLISTAAAVDGAELSYRVEERILGKFLPGMSVSANGYRAGIGAVQGAQGPKPPTYIQNWLYILYDPEFCSAGLNVGYKDTFEDNAKYLDFKPYVYWNFFNNLLSAGLAGGIQMGFDLGKSFDAFYNFWFLEPQVKVSINSNFYTALVYRYISGSHAGFNFKNQKTNWVNIRLCYTF